MTSESLYPSSSVDASLNLDDFATCVITHSPLNVQAIINSVGDDAAGAIATFIGTTRNSFKGKVVTRLEYQAYSKLAIKTMAEIVTTARQNATQANSHSIQVAPAASASASELTSSAQFSVVHMLIKCAVYHRLGVVPVGEPSIVIAVSSPHRKAAFIACEQILEDVKDRAQIWKREFYEGEPDSTAEWKANH